VRTSVAGEHVRNAGFYNRTCQHTLSGITMNRPQSHKKYCTSLSALALGLSLTACSNMPMSAPFSQAALPMAVQVPAGHTVALETSATGDITYLCRKKADQTDSVEWGFVGPDAGLKNRMGKDVGKYYGPPATWASTDGSKVTGAQLAVADAGAGNIPLQLVKANPAMGQGQMQGVQYIQRVATRGGVAPSDACNLQKLGQRQVVRYSADYIFWRRL
jgi:hypothetical protein